MSSTAKPTLNWRVNSVPAVESALVIAEGINSASRRQEEQPAWTRAVTRLYS